VTQVGSSSANTLVVFVHDRWTDDDARTLVDGVAACTRQDAGLMVVLVLGEGAIDPSAADDPTGVRAVADGLEAPLAVHEDVDAGWSTAFDVASDNGAASWRLLSPDGGMLWKKDDPVEPSELAAVLDGCLSPSAKATTSAIQVDLEWGPTALATLLDVGYRRRPGVDDYAYPPFTGMRPADMASVVSTVSFIRKDAASSTTELDRLRADNAGRGERDPGVLLVLDGATDAEAGDLAESLGPAFMVIGDPDGSLAAGAGVHLWPTTTHIGKQRGGRG
jgi:hypothetical protein